jgi:DDE superfamily endonuclease
MSHRLPVPPAPGPLEAYTQAFDDLFTKRTQRAGFRRYLEGLLLPTERNKTLTGLANTEPDRGAQHATAQRLQWFLTESTWAPEALNQRRLAVLGQTPATAPHAGGVLVLDETGDRKWGTKTAHVGRQYLGSIGKIDNGIVSVSSLWADASVYYPLDVEPYTPAHWFAKGQADSAFRTKPAIAIELVKRAQALTMPFRAIVADAFYGSHLGFRGDLAMLGVPYVLAEKPSHAWWHREGEMGSACALAQAAPWQVAQPGAWQPLLRRFRDGHTERWWALEAEGGPYGRAKAERLVIASTDPATLPDATTWYLVTNLPAPGAVVPCPHAPAAVAEVVRLYGLRVWVEQSYKQVKQTLGWTEYQVRADRAIRRHWQLVVCAFSFCWWAEASLAGPVWGLSAAAAHPAHEESGQEEPVVVPLAAPGKKKPRRPRSLRGAPKLVHRFAPCPGVAGARDHAVALLARVVGQGPTPRLTTAPGLAVGGTRDRSLYPVTTNYR